MATQRCPKCKSSRVRQGYRPTPILLKIAFTYNLLCDECNWEFIGFAIPGTVTKKTKKKKNVHTDVANFSTFDSEGELDVEDSTSISEKDSKQPKATVNTIAATNLESDLLDNTAAKNNGGKQTAKNKPKVKRKVRVKMH